MQSKISSFFKPSAVAKAADATRPLFVGGDGNDVIEDHHGTSRNRYEFLCPTVVVLNQFWNPKRHLVWVGIRQEPA